MRVRPGSPWGEAAGKRLGSEPGGTKQGLAEQGTGGVAEGEERGGGERAAGSAPCFADLPLPEGAVLLDSRSVRLGELRAYHLAWRWAGLAAESLAIPAAEVAHLDDGALCALARSLSGDQGHAEVTVVRGPGPWVLVSFNFSVD